MGELDNGITREMVERELAYANIVTEWIYETNAVNLPIQRKMMVTRMVDVAYRLRIHRVIRRLGLERAAKKILKRWLE